MGMMCAPFIDVCCEIDGCCDGICERHGFCMAY